MDANSRNTQKAISTATATLALIAGAISVASGFAYLIAYRYLTGYFHKLGCDWAVDLYPPTQIIQTAAPVAVTATAVAFGIWNAFRETSEFKTARWEIFWLFVAAAVCYGVHLSIEKFAPAYKSHFVWPSIILAYLGAIGAIIEFIKRVMIAQGVAWGSVLLLILTAYGIFAYSSNRGASHAEETIAGENGRGVPVRIKGQQESYRLARIVPYDRALVFSETADGKRTFRVVSVADIYF